MIGSTTSYVPLSPHTHSVFPFVAFSPSFSRTLTRTHTPACRYGFGGAVKDARVRFTNAVKKNRSTNVYCAMFGRLWGLFDPLDELWCDFYLEWLAPLVEARSTDAASPVKHGMQYMVCVCVCV